MVEARGADDIFGGDGEADKNPKKDIRLALEQWVENNVAPGTMIATKYAGSEGERHAVMTRPLCPYPASAQYEQTGDPADAASFTCSKK